MESNFFSKKYFKSVFFCHQSVQLFSKNRRNGLIFFLFFSKIYENCTTSIFSIHLMSNYQTLIKACINTTYKKIGILSIFEKKISSEKKKSQYYHIQDYVMHTKNYIFFLPKFFFRKMFVCVQNLIFGLKKNIAYKIQFVIEKKFGANFQNNLKKFAYKFQLGVEKKI